MTVMDVEVTSAMVSDVEVEREEGWLNFKTHYSNGVDKRDKRTFIGPVVA